MKLNYQKYSSPAGTLYIVSDESVLRGIVFQSQWAGLKKKIGAVVLEETPVIREAWRQLSEYFAGRRVTFDLPYELDGTEFQKKVWRALAKVPFGKTTTYKIQAQIVGSPKAVRAVGRTNGLNPLCIVLPCHRVVGTSGKLTGYAGGLDVKEYLLKLESIQV